MSFKNAKDNCFEACNPALVVPDLARTQKQLSHLDPLGEIAMAFIRFGQFRLDLEVSYGDQTDTDTSKLPCPENLNARDRTLS